MLLRSADDLPLIWENMMASGTTECRGMQSWHFAGKILDTKTWHKVKPLLKYNSWNESPKLAPDSFKLICRLFKLLGND